MREFTLTAEQRDAIIRRFTHSSPETEEKFRAIDPGNKREDEILIYGNILTSADAAFLREVLGDKTVMSSAIFQELIDAIDGDFKLRVNSKGGDIFETQAIINLISERKRKGDRVHVQIDGMAASAASLIAITGDQIDISPLSNVMIHGIQLVTFGDVKRVQKIVNNAEKMNKSVASLYAKRMKDFSLEQVQAKLEEETWFSAEEAVEVGLADRLLEPEIDESKDNESKLQAETEAIRLEQQQRYETYYALNGM